MRNKKLVVLGVAVAVLALAGASHAQMGVGVMWDADWATGGGIAPIMTLPIMTGEGLVIQPMAAFLSVKDQGTEFLVGASVEKQAREGTSPLFGGKVLVDIGSPDQGDGWTNFSFGVFLGGTASLGDNVDLVGSWGPTVAIYAKESPVYTDATIITTEANITVRWWVFGQ